MKKTATLLLIMAIAFTASVTFASDIGIHASKVPKTTIAKEATTELTAMAAINVQVAYASAGELKHTPAFAPVNQSPLEVSAEITAPALNEPILTVNRRCSYLSSTYSYINTGKLKQSTKIGKERWLIPSSKRS